MSSTPSKADLLKRKGWFSPRKRCHDCSKVLPREKSYTIGSAPFCHECYRKRKMREL